MLGRHSNSFGEEIALAPLAVASAAPWWSSARAVCRWGAQVAHGRRRKSFGLPRHLKDVNVVT